MEHPRPAQVASLGILIAFVALSLLLSSSISAEEIEADWRTVDTARLRSEVRYLLDTNTVSALMRGEPHVATRVAGTPREDVAISQVTAAEIECGLRYLPASKRRRALEECTRWPTGSPSSPRIGRSSVFGSLERAGWPDAGGPASGRPSAFRARRRFERAHDLLDHPPPNGQARRRSQP